MGCNSSKSTAVEGDQPPKTANDDQVDAPEDGVTPGEGAANTDSTDPNQNASWDDWSVPVLHCAYLLSLIAIRTEYLTTISEVTQYNILSNIYMFCYQIAEWKPRTVFFRLLQH